MRRFPPLAMAVLFACVGGCASTGSFTPTTLATGFPAANHLLVDLSSLYLTTHDGTSTHFIRVSKHDEEPPAVVATTKDEVADVAIDGDSLYWVVAHPDVAQPVDTIRRVNKYKPGPPVTVVSSANRVTSLALDAMHLYWTQGGDPSSADPFRTPGVLRKMLIGAGSPSNIVFHQQGLPTNLTLNGTHVFWVNFEQGSDATIMMVAKSGGEPVQLASMQDIVTRGVPPEIAADDDHVYYLTDMTVMKVPIRGGQALELARVRGADAAHLAYDSKSLYFTAETGVMLLPLDTRKAVGLSNQGASDIAVDARAVYWARSGAILQLLK